MSGGSTSKSLSWTVMVIVQSLLLAGMLLLPTGAIAKDNGNGNGADPAQAADQAKGNQAEAAAEPAVDLYLIAAEDKLTEGDVTVVEAVTCDPDLKDKQIVGDDEKLGTKDDDPSCSPAKQTEWTIDGPGSLNKDQGASVRLSTSAAGTITLKATLDDLKAKLDLTIDSAPAPEQAAAPSKNADKSNNGQAQKAANQDKKADVAPATGNDKTPPGQDKKADVAPATGNDKTPPGQDKKADVAPATGNDKTPPGQAKKADVTQPGHRQAPRRRTTARPRRPRTRPRRQTRRTTVSPRARRPRPSRLRRSRARPRRQRRRPRTPRRRTTARPRRKPPRPSRPRRRPRSRPEGSRPSGRGQAQKAEAQAQAEAQAAAGREDEQRPGQEGRSAGQEGRAAGRAQARRGRDRRVHRHLQGQLQQGPAPGRPEERRRQRREGHRVAEHVRGRGASQWPGPGPRQAQERPCGQEHRQELQALGQRDPERPALQRPVEPDPDRLG